MSMVSLESTNEKKVSNAILHFLAAYGILQLLRKCGELKLKGVPSKDIFIYTLLCSDFCQAPIF